MKNLTNKILAVVMAAAMVLGACARPACAQQEEVARLLKGLELGKPFNYENLTIVPIYSKQARKTLDYTTLDEAVKNGYVVISEIEGGRVPQVKVTNKSDCYIFLMAGEILTGAKQNRLVGKDVLLGPGDRDVIVPVYCVEQGRWQGQSYEFKSGGFAAAPMFRQRAAAKASQAEIWSGVACYSAALDASSPTQDLAVAYDMPEVKEKVGRYVTALQDIPRLDQDAVGVAVVIGNEIVTIDIFENPQLFAKLWPKLLRSYAMGAIAAPKFTNNDVTQEQVKNILNMLYRKDYERKPGTALGEDLSATTVEITSIALVYKESVVHLSAFPNERDRKPVIDYYRTPVIID